MEASDGGVAEWSIALVLKTSVPKGTQGSNPCPSAKHLCSISQNVARGSSKRFPAFVLWQAVRFGATARGHLLRRFLRHLCAGFCAACRAVEVIVRRLGVVLQAHLRVVPHPECDDVNGKRLQQFGFSTRSQVVKHAGPCG